MRKLSVRFSGRLRGSKGDSSEGRRGKDVERSARDDRAQRVPLQTGRRARKPMRATFIGGMGPAASCGAFAAELADQ